jgi:tryptophan-rich sensory protein
MSHPRHESRRGDPLLGALLLGGALLASGLLSALYSPAPLNGRIRRDYERLDKPPFTPPDWAFGIWGPLWTALAVAGWRLWRAPYSPARSQALLHWFGAQGLNVAWLWLGFGRRRRGAMTLESAVSVGNAAALAASARKVDPAASALTLPYLAWLGFAGLLSYSLWRRNQDRLRHPPSDA